MLYFEAVAEPSFSICLSEVAFLIITQHFVKKYVHCTTEHMNGWPDGSVAYVMPKFKLFNKYRYSSYIYIRTRIHKVHYNAKKAKVARCLHVCHSSIEVILVFVRNP